jgi:hypothetical protein
MTKNEVAEWSNNTQNCSSGILLCSETYGNLLGESANRLGFGQGEAELAPSAHWPVLRLALQLHRWTSNSRILGVTAEADGRCGGRWPQRLKQKRGDPPVKGIPALSWPNPRVHQRGKPPIEPQGRCQQMPTDAALNGQYCQSPVQVCAFAPSVTDPKPMHCPGDKTAPRHLSAIIVRLAKAGPELSMLT